MFKSKIKSKYRKNRNSRFYQGDILTELDFLIGDIEKTVEKYTYQLPYAVILSQDCDLKSDFRSRKEKKDQDKNLLTILVCPAYNLQTFSEGKHMAEWQMATYNKTLIERIQKNDIYKRYHCLNMDHEYNIPNLVLDFKHFFTIPRDFLYEKRKDKYVASLNEIFREEISQRFSNYLSRIGLPEI